ncbi:hypothetical protein VB005_05830 [Metarhizium brunneum]
MTNLEHQRLLMGLKIVNQGLVSQVVMTGLLWPVGLAAAHFRSIFQISLLHPSTQHGVGELSRPADPSRELLPGSGLAEVVAGAL